VAIVIIAILAALLLPAIQGARRSAQEARVIIEIKNLEQAIAAFKVKYGVEPPSRMSIHLTQTDWNNDPPSKSIIKRMWPQFDFTMPGGAGVAYPPGWSGTLNMKSGECLLFFLGGILENKAPIGFAKNPATPFSPRSAVANREGPFMEFIVDRINDSDGNNIYEYNDSLPNQNKPYLYFSSYEGRGYRVTLPNLDLPSNNANTAFTLLHDVYRTGTNAGQVPPAAPQTSAQGSQTLPAQKAQTFQIISPGMDNDYGVGGLFNPTLTNAGLSNRSDYDNLTNFHSGRLNP
jgi:hypothetical protein